MSMMAHRHVHGTFSHIRCVWRRQSVVGGTVDIYISYEKFDVVGCDVRERGLESSRRNFIYVLCSMSKNDDPISDGSQFRIGLSFSRKKSKRIESKGIFAYLSIR